MIALSAPTCPDYYTLARQSFNKLAQDEKWTQELHVLIYFLETRASTGIHGSLATVVVMQTQLPKAPVTDQL